MRILIAEDTEDSRIMLQMVLENQGYKVISCKNGKEALENCKKFQPDLIISDILMPEMDGFELCRQLKLDKDLKKIPLIFYTATYTEKQDMDLAKALGALRFVLKPEEPKKLLAIIQEVVNQSKEENTNISQNILKDEYTLSEMHLHSVSRKLDKKVQELMRAEKNVQLRKKELQESEEHYLNIFNSTTDAILIFDMNGKIIDANPQACKMYDYNYEELINLSYKDIIHPDHNTLFQNFKQAIEISNEFHTETLDIHKDGTSFNVDFKGTEIIFNGKPHLLAIIRDITERKRKDELLMRNLDEKSTLLRELYHRTKNNMQVISAMLNMQAHHTDNEYIQTTFKEITNKINAMSLVHQKLYQAQDLSQINLKEYIEDIIKLLIKSYRPYSRKVTFKFDLDDVFVLIDSAIPFGLILNELVSNSLKHAFPKNTEGEIYLKINRNEDNTIFFLISDNGIGLPKNFDSRESIGMGLQTVFSLINYQLNGEIKYENLDGLKWIIKYKDDIHKKRV